MRPGPPAQPGAAAAGAPGAAAFTDVIVIVLLAVSSVSFSVTSAANAFLHRFDDPVTRGDAGHRPLAALVGLGGKNCGLGFPFLRGADVGALRPADPPFVEDLAGQPELATALRRRGGRERQCHQRATVRLRNSFMLQLH